MTKYFLFCDEDIEIMFNEYGIKEIYEYIENEFPRCDLFVWIDGETNPEDILLASQGFETYFLLDEDEYKLLNEVI